MFLDEVPDKSPSEEGLIDAKRTHPNRKTRRTLIKMFLGKRVDRPFGTLFAPVEDSGRKRLRGVEKLAHILQGGTNVTEAQHHFGSGY